MMAFKKLGVVALTALIALLIPFKILDPQEAANFIKKFGYGCIFVTSFLFFWLLFTTLKSKWTGWGFLKTHRTGVLVILGASVFTHMHEPHQHKILYDEYVLTATSMNMHFHRETSTPFRSHLLRGQVVNVNNFVDKRPFFYAFLLSLVHDFTGYRVENPFFLNGFLTIVLFSLLYKLCLLLGGEKNGKHIGIISILLFATSPLLTQNLTGAGFEILNICMILALILSAHYYLKSPDDTGMGLLILTAILLGQTRYESMLFLFVLVIIVGGKWIHQKKITLSWWASLTPLLLIPPLALSKVFFSNRSFLQLSSAKEKAFELSNIPENISQAVFYLFNFDTDINATNSVLLSFLGIISLVFIIVQLLTRPKTILSHPSTLWGVYSVLLIVLVNLGILLSYYWGQISDPMVSRLSLPLHLFFVISFCIVLKEFLGNKTFPIKLHLALGTYLLLFTIPSNARSSITHSLITSMEMRWLQEYIKNHTTENTLILCESSLPALSNQRPSVPGFRVNQRQANIKYYLDTDYFDEIIIFQRIEKNPKTFEEVDLSGNRFDKSFIMETIQEMRFRENKISRINRLVDVDLSKAEMITTATGALFTEIIGADPSNAIKKFLGQHPHNFLAEQFGFPSIKDQFKPPEEGFESGEQYQYFLIRNLP